MTTQGMPSMDPRPSGLTIGTYDTYREAQRAVDYLSDEKFPVEHTTIVGNNLRQVEKITGRLTWARPQLRAVGRPPRLHLPDRGGGDDVRRTVRLQVRRRGPQPPGEAGAEG
jgi:hypothetical protein